MRKIYLLAIGISMLFGNSFAQDTLNLYSPVNLQALFQQPAVQLTWEAPVDTLSSNDTIPPGLIGYRIYSNNELLGFTQHPVLSFNDATPEIPVNFYKATAVYDLSFYGFPGDTAESAPSNITFVITDSSSLHQLPFTEQFTTGLFETNQWEAESENWQIAGQAGNPAPSANFNYGPVLTNYSNSLTSDWMDGSSFIDGDIMISFDLKHDNINPTGTEILFLDVYNGEEWIEETSFPSVEDFNWQIETINITNTAKGKPFKVRFRAQGESTLNINYWQVDNIEIWRECKTPFDLQVEYLMGSDCELLIEWASPEISPPPHSTWLYWDNGTNFSAIGLQGGGTFSVAIRFTPAQLAEHAGTSLTKIKMYPFSSGGTIVLKVWTGANASQLELSQPVDSYTAGQWNEFNLNTPVLISGTTELWFGYEVTHGADYVAGTDAGPAVVGYGDMISLDGSVWESMSQAYSLNFNWNIEGYITACEKVVELKRSKSLISYNLYRDEIFIANTTETEYIDYVKNYSAPCYNVTAVYIDCESEFSEEDCWPHDCNYSAVNDYDVPTFDIYPNPASDKVTIDYTGNINNMKIIDMMGRELAEYPLSPGNTSKTLDLTKFPEGIYLLRFEANDGRVYGKKLVRGNQ